MSMNGIEKHIQSVFQLLILAVLVWFGNKTMATSDIVIRLEVQGNALRADMAELSGELTAATFSRYTANEAEADQKINDLIFKTLDKRMVSYENRLALIESMRN